MSVEYLFDNSSNLVLDNTGGLVWWGDKDAAVYEDQYRGLSMIAHEAVTAVTADSESPNYPAANVLDDYPQNQWRAMDATVLSATMTASISGKIGRITMHNVVADTAIVTISDPNTVEWESGTTWESGTEWANIDIGSTTIFSKNNFDEYGAVKVVFPEFEGTAEVRITLSKSSWSDNVLGIGKLCAGEVIALEHNPDYGLTEVPVDRFSTERELSNGSPYYKKRNIPREFSGRILVDYSVFTRMVSEVWRRYGKQPKSYQITDIYGRESLVYGRLPSMPSGSHDYINKTYVDLTIQEVM